MEPTTTEAKKRGRPTGTTTVDERKVNASIYATPTQIQYLLTWNEGGPTLAFGELLDELKKTRPRGRFSAPAIDPEARNRPGTKTDLKRKIRALEKQLRAAGIQPVTEATQ
jgi:hypothetical protein